MSDKRATLRERTQRFRRRMRGQDKAVSPVVATLILILIAVAAAAALYLWLVAWQGNITGGIGNQGVQATFTIGGSTSVYPFSSLAVSWFEQNHSDVAITDDQGGTGAGMLAVCAGHVDVGAASSLETVTGLQTSDGCPTTPGITITTIAYDAVDVILPAANPMGIGSMNSTVLLSIYLADSSSTPYAAMPAYGTALGLTVGGGAKWSQIPTTANCGGTCTLSTDKAAILTVSRSDASGTTQAFEARLLGYTSSSAGAQPYASLGFSGCGSNNLLADCGISTNLTGNGNPGVIAAVAANPGAIGYASDGLARVSGSGVTCQGIPTASCGVAFAATGQTTPIAPSLGATGSIASGIKNGLTATTGYAGWRPFEFVTLQPPAGEVQDFFTFITAPDVNQNLATATGEVSIYSI